ncbi:MAG: RHS repeat-associated core domain-containing protein [Gemmatimonadales bacterium]|nr:RHS repeat-associated core domain-containing protein [Gemmatimonadales bacterium]MDZ4390186.1 RHS repeat-associated core domain-containing protein [Gemmatimonadales bacterium]
MADRRDVGRACPERSEGIQQFRNRAYDPATGTWIQEDPMGVAGGVNLYRFNNGNPVSFGDPLGLCPVCLLGAAGAAIGGVGQVASNLLNDRPVLQGVGQAVGVGAAAGLTLGLAAPAITASVLGAAGAPAVVAGTSSINITSAGLGHVLARHVAGGAQVTGKSIFTGGAEDVRALIKVAEGVTPTLQQGGNFQRIVDAGRAIGIDRAAGAPTSVYTVVTNKSGDLVTAFPGVP